MLASEVRQALSSLYDPLELAHADVCRYFPEVNRRRDSHSRAQALRTILIAAIERLQPPASNVPLTPSLRGYEFVSLHFVQRMTLAEAAEELHVSPRQAYRDLSLALEKLTEYLAGQAGTVEPNADAHEPILDDELQSMPVNRQPLELRQVVAEALEVVQPLAAERGVAIRNLLPQVHRVNSDRALLRQLLTALVSWSVRHAAGQEVVLTALPERRAMRLQIRFQVRRASELSPSGGIQGLCEVLGGELTLRQEGELAESSLRLPLEGRSRLLVIEDNPGMVELYRRLLQDSDRYEVTVAPSPEAAAAMAQSLQPDAVILDILMPVTDGWAVLRSLRAEPATSHIPVIVVSVFEEEELARILGASGYLAKPVTRERLLATLASCLG